MFVKLFVILAFISIGGVFGGGGLLESITGFDTDHNAPEEVNDDNDSAGSSKEMIDVEDAEDDDQVTALDEPQDRDKEETTGVEPQGGDNEKPAEVKGDSAESEWDCFTLSDTVSKCIPKRQFAAFKKKVPSAAAGIPNNTPKGVPEPQDSVRIEGSLQEWCDDFFGKISKIHDKIKENVESLQTILGV